MSDLKPFKLSSDHVTELTVSSMALEKSLQTLIERHLETFLGVTFLASEYSTGPKTGGRMDTLGIDENGAPVIIEYKKATNANVINQGLFYLDWLLDHRGDYELLVIKSLGAEKPPPSTGAALASSASPAISPNTISTPLARCSAISNSSATPATERTSSPSISSIAPRHRLLGATVEAPAPEVESCRPNPDHTKP
jgi:hypothetical protein